MRIGTVASPTLLAAPHARRAALVAQILEQGIDHVFVADHVSFHVGTGMDAARTAMRSPCAASTRAVAVGAPTST